MTSALLIAATLLSLAGAASAQERPWTPLPSPASVACPGGVCQPEALAPFLDALAQTDATVRIVQFGDSHTAGDIITGSLRWRLQSRLGPDRAVSVVPIGEVGATLRSLADRSVAFEPGAAPDLIILAYGTNEGFDELLDPTAYEALLRSQVARLRAAAPGAALMILGPPDAMRGDGGGTCADDPERRWRTPLMLPVVRDVQQRVAADMGVAFWDWSGRMGGACSAHRLAIQAEPMVRPDHIHFTYAGGDWIGALLFDDLMAAHDARAGRGEAR